MLKVLAGAVGAIERHVLDSVAAVTPWLAPVMPAYIAYHNIHTVLGLPQWLALVGGVVVECLGLSAIHTTFQLWQWNDAGGGFRAPARLAASTGAAYLTIVLVVNVMLDIGVSPDVYVLAKALLSLMSVPAGVLIAVRAQHRRRVEESELEKQRLDAEAARQAELDALARQQAEESALELEKQRLVAEAARQAELDALARQQAEERALERRQARELRHAERLAEIRAQSTVLRVNSSGIPSGGDGISVKSYAEFADQMNSMNGTAPKSAADAGRMFKLPATTAWRYWRKFMSEVEFSHD